MTQNRSLQEMSMDELDRLLRIRRQFCKTFRRQKSYFRWVRRVQEVEAEIAKREAP